VYMAKTEEEIDEIKNKDSHLAKLAEQINETRKDALLEAKHLHDIRRQSADSLVKEVKKEVASLYLEKATFSISFTPKINEAAILDDNNGIKLHKNGFDHVQFMVSTNPGEPLKELDKIASGGELSRFMLILKKIFSRHQGITSVI